MILDLNLIFITLIPIFAFFVIGLFLGIVVGFILSWFDLKKRFTRR